MHSKVIGCNIHRLPFSRPHMSISSTRKASYLNDLHFYIQGDPVIITTLVSLMLQVGEKYGERGKRKCSNKDFLSGIRNKKIAWTFFIHRNNMRKYKRLSSVALFISTLFFNEIFYSYLCWK